VPARYGVVRGAWRNFVPRQSPAPAPAKPAPALSSGSVEPTPIHGGFFAERMTVRFTRPTFEDHPLGTHWKSAHRAAADVRIGRGNHEAFGDGLVPLRGWYPFEILHFPVRSLEHCMRKYVTQFVALEKNAEKGIPAHMAEAYGAYRAGRLEEFYEPLVVDDDELGRRLEDGTLAGDTRLRDALRALRDDRGFRLPGAVELDFGRPSVTDDALFAAELSALQESDLALSLGARIEDLEGRVGRLERGALPRRLARVREAARRVRRA
jgi:hypothetical protein